MPLRQDFERFQRLHSWYKHIPLEGQDFYAFQAVGEQARNGVHPQVADLSGIHWHFSGYKPEGIESYKTRVGPFLRGVEGMHEKMSWGLWIIRDLNPTGFRQLIETKYPQWVDVNWASIEHIIDNPIVIELFEREVADYWDELIRTIPDTLRG